MLNVVIDFYQQEDDYRISLYSTHRICLEEVYPSDDYIGCIISYCEFYVNSKSDEVPLFYSIDCDYDC